MITRRLLETLAMAIIGDSVLSIVSPRRHTSLWLEGPAGWERAVQPFVKHPAATRLLGVLGLGFGIWLAWRQEDQVTQAPSEQPKGMFRRLEEAMR